MNFTSYTILPTFFCIIQRLCSCHENERTEILFFSRKICILYTAHYCHFFAELLFNKIKYMITAVDDCEFNCMMLENDWLLLILMHGTFLILQVASQSSSTVTADTLSSTATVTGNIYESKTCNITMPTFCALV